MNQQNRTINASRNVASSFLNKIVILLLTFVSRKFFIEYIGLRYLGINGLFSNVLTLLSLADLGLGTAMNVSLYKPIAENDTRKLSALLNYYRQLYRLIALGIMLIGLSLIPLLKYIVNMDQDIPHLYLYYVIFVFKSAVSYLFAYKSSIIRADQKNYLINRIDVFVKIAKVLLQIIAVWLFQKYLFYLLIEVFAVISHNLVVAYVADKNYSFIADEVQLADEEKRGVFSNMSSVFLYKIAWSLLNGTDNILISIICGTVFVGYYSNYLSITGHLDSFIALLFTSLTASVGNLIATASADRRYKTFQAMQMVSFWICGVVVVCLFYLTQDFMYLWLGEQYILDDLTLYAIILNTFFTNCMRPVWTYREGTGMYRQIRYIMFVTAIVNLILSVLLGKWLGLSGILFATSISKLSTYFWYEPNILFRDFFGIKPTCYYLEYLKNIGLVLLCGTICYVPMHFIQWKKTLVFWCLRAMICFAFVNAVYYIRYHKTEAFHGLRLRVKQIVQRFHRKKSNK